MKSSLFNDKYYNKTHSFIEFELEPNDIEKYIDDNSIDYLANINLFVRDISEII